MKIRTKHSFFKLFCILILPWLASIQTALADSIISPKKGKTYRHVTGFSFWYPAAWQIKELEEAIQLIPPHVKSTASGPAEIYYISGESVAGTGIVHAHDPRVIQYSDQTVRSVVPGLMRENKTIEIGMVNGKGVMLHWKGNNNDGKPIEAKAYIAIANDLAIALSAIAHKGIIAKRNSDLEQIFASFAFGQGKQDPKLVCRWTLFSTRSMVNDSVWETDWSRAQAVSDTNSVLVFQPNGRWTRTDTSHMLAGAGGVWIESKDRDVSKGKWYANEGVLFMIWDNNTWEDYKYVIQTTEKGRELRMINGKTGQAWKCTD